ncbi:hypothetical protein [Methanoregula sp.]|uniref:hypothetical protein n=1 Tax=Methanoregula sp. TaxID=2052170 RepID=UPI002CE1DFB3|nr:hypothetical protein [Methanoregula sp.]HVP96199.1 hypothetical protein [Methanoregula sp.]
MKYTPRHVKKFFEEGKIDPELWKIHFPHLLPSHVPECSECEDKKNDLCQGGKNPVDCFLGIYAEEEAKKAADDAGHKSRKEKVRKFFPDAKGKRAKTPAGANITFDQSKM